MSFKAQLFLSSVSLLAFATSARAQQTAPAPAPTYSDAPDAAVESGQTAASEKAPQGAAGASDGAATATAQDIVVTGSRIARNGNSSPSPVTVVGVSDVLTTTPGVSLGEALNTIPAFSGSRQSTSNPTNTGAQSGGNGAANALNLRNLGSTRTLILEDGRRVPPTLFNGLVDVDIIPQMLIDRVDLVTGGVSAVYGSDAVSGVVNYVVNRKLQGFRAQVSSGISRYGDDARNDIGVAYGTKIGDRLHIEASYEYRTEDPITSRASRPYLNQVGVTGAGTTANPYVLQTNLRQSGFPAGGLITSGALAGKEFSANGVLTPFVAGIATGTSGVQIGGDGGYFDGSLISGSVAHQAFGRADYEITDSIHAFVQASGDWKTNTSDGDSAQLSNVTINRTNAFLPATVQSQIPVTQQTFTYSELLNQIPDAHENIVSRQYVFTGGFDGKIDRFKWAIDYTHGSTTLINTLSNDVNRQKLSAALDAVSSNGQIVCNASLTNTAYANCVPFNAFGPSAASAAAIAYVTDPVTYRTLTTTDDATAQINGDLFQGWAGPITAALSGEWRRIAFKSTSTSAPSNVADCTGLRYNCVTSTSSAVAATALNDFQFGASPGGLSQTVWEVAGEVEVPVLKDLWIFKALNVNGAARYTNYSTSGHYVTWKIGGDLEITDSLRFRATRSRDIRAPTLYELYAPSNQTIVRSLDVLTGLSPSTPQVTLANPTLTAEIGNTFTAGVVWKPTHSLSFAVDGYHINISNAITQVTGSTTNLQNACYASGGTSPYCALQVRPNAITDTSAANVVSKWLVQNINLSEIDTYGIDVEANFSSHLFGRLFQARVLAAYQPHIKYIQPGVATVDQGDVAFGPLGLYAAPSVRINANVRYQFIDNMTVEIGERYRNPMKLGGDPTQVFVDNHIGSFYTTSLNLAWDVKSRGNAFQFFVNVQNLFDAQPPLGAYSGNGTRAGLRDGFAIGDDVRGRYFTAGAKVQF
ncbi:TonB-dependent receptor [Sphingomonas sp. TF3]|uniref:TonB-dependent receptor plug domain-containing protein n=1 Tax=Sphingomonas sp. TF3 TaxID=2495580 RepID=UPI000F862ADA|nr:TonB-dependent receptor [Sphingomonas sp. TF3]RUN76994.1 TonB-dependent receptor [Sphingomonas sp. TF3]